MKELKWEGNRKIQWLTQQKKQNNWRSDSWIRAAERTLRQRSRAPRGVDPEARREPSRRHHAVERKQRLEGTQSRRNPERTEIEPLNETSTDQKGGSGEAERSLSYLVKGGGGARARGAVGERRGRLGFREAWERKEATGREIERRRDAMDVGEGEGQGTTQRRF